ncbi:MAG: bifunctional acetaldehyde-CoA/alcohol dehydrogenase [Spirochaetales bacterium]|nr:bifunctional acetaldehyde-CoA/alcohol dehydrogenase [Spirochaetales bacterium]
MADKKKATAVAEATKDGKSLLEDIIRQAATAQAEYATYSQNQVDEIFRVAATAANEARISLAKQARQETGMGIVEDKVIKNHFASEYIYNKYKNLKTCGVVEEDEAMGIRKIAEPLGVLAGVVPTTNPTSTAIFKTLLALKTRNAIVLSPHPRAKGCTIEAARIVQDAAIAAGAPAGLIGWIETPSVELSAQLMSHSAISAILATGGPGMVNAAYSSGKPALGVGAGNTPALIDETADIEMAVSSILMSKTFDNGVICASEQSVVAVEAVYSQLKAEFAKRGAYLLNNDEKKKVAAVISNDGKLNAAIVGQSAFDIAKLAGVTVPAEAKVLIGEINSVGNDEPFSWEKLSPVLALFKEKNFDAALARAQSLVEYAGMGHTSVLYTNPANADRCAAFGQAMKTGRTLVNMPASQGAIGDLFNFSLAPSLTLGCGSWGGNSVSQNVGPEHLLNYKTVAYRKENTLWFKLPPKVYFKSGCTAEALKDLAGKKRAFVVTDRFLHQNGYLAPVVSQLERLGIATTVFADVLPDPTLETAYAGAKQMEAVRPDVILAFGGGSPMDAAKIMWLLYEHPESDFKDMAMRFMDIRKRVYTFPAMGDKATFVAIPTTSGTGSEVTPFAVITDEKTGQKYPIADYALTPHMAIVDADMVRDMPPSLTAFSGIDALTHALEAIVSVVATEFTTPMALEAIKNLFDYLPRSYKNGGADPEAREKVHHAANMAGMAFANAFLGVCHSMAHKLGARHHIPHGLANALLINEVIRFNATEAPLKQGIFPQYKRPEALARYARVADYLGLGGKTDEEKVEKLLTAIDQLKAQLDIPADIASAGVDEKDFMASLDQMSEDAFDDQCTGANPRYPLITELTEMYRKAYRRA